MRRGRAAALALLLALAAGCGEDPGPAGPPPPPVADLGVRPQPQEAQGAALRYTPPAGRWRVRSGEPAPEQWYEEYASEDGRALLRVFVFPVRDAADPAVVLPQALDVFLRSLGSEGFGLPVRRRLDVIGAPAAEVTWSAVVGTGTVEGEARLLRSGRATWGFAVGYAGAGAPPERREAVRAFAASLEPLAPVFYERRFRPEDFPGRVVAHAAGEAPITLDQLMAVELVLEAGVGARFPLSTRDALESALRDDLQKGDATGRDAYRQTREALEHSLAMEPEARLEGMRGLGRRALQGLLKRATQGYAPAARYATVWRRLREVAVGTAEDGLTVGDVQCLGELCAFLASLGADREVRADKALGDRVARALAAGWATLAAAEKTALRDEGRVWAALRRDWDRAEPARRDALRARAYALLAGEASPPSVDAALLAAMRGLDDERVQQGVLRLAGLPAAERAALGAGLAAEPSGGWDLGW